jgi:hypothetical protein
MLNYSPPWEATCLSCGGWLSIAEKFSRARPAEKRNPAVSHSARLGVSVVHFTHAASGQARDTGRYGTAHVLGVLVVHHLQRKQLTGPQSLRKINRHTSFSRPLLPVGPPFPLCYRWACPWTW